jgi:DNA-directed RNA polymerase subunit RPC12/RpoP
MSIEFTCSQCGQLLRVSDADMGKIARCPQCGTESRIRPPDPYSPGLVPLIPAGHNPPVPSSPAAGPGASDPAARADQGTWGTGTSGPERGGDPNPYASPAPSQPELAQSYQQYQFGKPHRGDTIHTLGLVGLILSLLGVPLSLCCGFFACILQLGALGTSIGGLVMANADLAEMDQGLMDSNGRAKTQTGRTMAIAGIVITVVVLAVMVLFVAIFVAIQAANNAN